MISWNSLACRIITTAVVGSLALALGTGPASASESPDSTSPTVSATPPVDSPTSAQLFVLRAPGLTATDGRSLREPAGKYYYVCVATNGSTNTIPVGVATDTCHGSYLLVYLNGVKVHTISLTEWAPTSDPGTITVDCLLAYFGGFLVVTGPAGELWWVVASAVSGGINYYRACLA